MKKKVFISILLICVMLSLTACAGNMVVCNKFELLTKVTGSYIDISVDTDLPDNTVIIVAASRSYWMKGDDSEHVVYFFQEKSTVGTWKFERRIYINDAKWESNVKASKEFRSGIDAGLYVESVSDEVTVRVAVPINQPDPCFGKNNWKLTGKAVHITSDLMNLVDESVKIEHPLP